MNERWQYVKKKDNNLSMKFGVNESFIIYCFSDSDAASLWNIVIYCKQCLTDDM